MNDNAMPPATPRNSIADIIPDRGYGMEFPTQNRISPKQDFEQYFLYSIFWTSTS
jgi:hypothetical protein